MSQKRIKSISEEMARFLRVSNPLHMTVAATVKSLDRWNREVTSSIQVSDNQAPLIEAKEALHSAEEALKSKDYKTVLTSVKSALESVTPEKPVKDPVSQHQKRSIKALLF